MVLQDKYSVQFDDLFKIAWEEDDVNIVPHEDDGEQLAGDEGTNGNLLPTYFICSKSHEYILLFWIAAATFYTYRYGILTFYSINAIIWYVF